MKKRFFFLFLHRKEESAMNLIDLNVEIVTIAIGGSFSSFGVFIPEL